METWQKYMKREWSQNNFLSYLWEYTSIYLQIYLQTKITYFFKFMTVCSIYLEAVYIQFYI